MSKVLGGIPPMGWELELAGVAGLSHSQLRFFLAFLASVAVSAVLRWLPNPRVRHWYAFLTGLFLVYYPFGDGCVHPLATTVLTYIIIRRMRQHCGTLTWLTIFPYLILAHVLGASGSAWRAGQLDFTGAQMVLTLKLIAAAVAHQDALRPADKLRPYPASKALADPPSLLEFLSYAFAAGNLLAGPFFEIRDYLDYMGRKGDWDEQDPKRRIPNPTVPGLLRLLKGLLFAALWFKLAAHFGPELLESAAWQQYSVPYRCVLIWLCGCTTRSKYYFAWGIAESGFIFSGLCYNGRDEQGKPHWDRYVNSRVRRVEVNPSLANLAANWNICTGNWLRHYVYDRLTPSGRRPTLLHMMATQLVSGVWHGLFPGYWLFFATSAVMFDSSKVLYRYEQTWPRRVAHFPLWVAFKVVFTAFVLNYAAAAFILLELRNTLALWSSVYFAGHVFIFGLELVGAVMPPRRQKANLKPQSATLAAAAAGDGEEQPQSQEGIKTE